MAKQKSPQEKDKVKKVKIDIETDNADSKTSGKSSDTNTGSQASGTNAGKQEQAADKQADTPKPTEETLASEKDKYLRLAAEYDNFRKRTAKERDSTYTNAKADVIAKLLPVYDNLERAIKMECTDEAYYKGIEMTMLQLTEILSDIGVKPIPTVGEPFDANFHNAVMRIEDKNLGEGIIAEECQKGFTMGERVIRFSSVIVAN